jgi:hypothetical protein
MDDIPDLQGIYDAAERQFRVSRESKWQKQMAPLAVVREIREVILTHTLMQETPTPQQNAILQRVLDLERKLLRKMAQKNTSRLMTELALDHHDSWREVIEWLKSDRQLTIVVELSGFVQIARQMLRQMQPDLE